MSVLALADAKAHLNTTTTTNDAELVDMINAAEAAISRKVGPLEPTTRTVRVPGGSSLVLPATPAVSLTSVTPVGGTALSLANLYLNPESGVVSDLYGCSFPAIAYNVVYVAGRGECPDDLVLAVKELVRHMWETQRGSVRVGPLQSDSLSNTLPGSAYTFPIRVNELLAPHVRFGFA